MKPREQGYVDTRCAVGPLKRGRRGFYVLGRRRVTPLNDAPAAPIIAYGVLESGLVRVTRGALSQHYAEILQGIAAGDAR